MGFGDQGVVIEEARSLASVCTICGFGNRQLQLQSGKEKESMSTTPLAASAPALPVSLPPVAYELAARRHMTDAEALFNTGRLANAGQLYGFVAECGLKALLMACGIQPGADGGIPEKRPLPAKGSHPLRTHIPKLMTNIIADFPLISDGAQATRYLALIPNLHDFLDWSIDHRYWRDSALPTASVNQWRAAAREIANMLDQAKQDGVLL
jgi:hypothetical protein